MAKPGGSSGGDESNEADSGEDQPDESGEFRSSPEVRTALISGNTFPATAVQYAVVDGLAIFEGDVILGTVEEVERDTEQLRAVMSGELAAGVVITGDQFRWPNCRIPYTIDSGLSNQARVTEAIAHWEEKTHYQFVVRTTESDYVTFRAGSGCSSMVGRRGGQQFVNLGSGCSKGNVIHEIGHVVGMWHEQSREDRDAFVTIHWDKIQPGFEHNFNQRITDGDDVGPYDYGSVMHYPRNAFSVNGSDTITPVDPTAQIGQRVALSAGDIAAVNSLCPKVLKEIPKDVIKETPWDTRKEMIKDLHFDTKKEVITDTRKELIKERIKEVAFDPPWAKQVADRTGPLVRPSPPVQPGLVTQPGLRPGGALPFAVVTPHHAPAAGEPTQLEAVATNLDAQLQSLADQLAQVEATRELLQAQYDETARLLQQAMEAHYQASSP